MNSVRYRAHITPSGTAISAPTPTIRLVPTIDEAIPPPTPPYCGGSWVRKPSEIELAPRLTTPKTSRPSAPTAITAAATAASSRPRLTAARRRRLPVATSGEVGSNSCAHRPIPIAEFSVNRRAMYWAMTFVARPITSRIAAR